MPWTPPPKVYWHWEKARRNLPALYQPHGPNVTRTFGEPDSSSTITFQCEQPSVPLRIQRL
uniref:Uncharacterized protein n=1 Tax=uncultured marine microorganism HF4000_ANIW93N21 TaxID=455527 RepID=B3T344_9ZZZZ|nr:hypothetical protein ALOHA_HF4000ANIW93N21ctg1g10 [uncultured marine microorganism HF4000_ANIW93N21]